MKAITLIQPWASLICDGRKKIETRSWPTSFRGRIAIHAGMKVDRDACIKFGYDPDKIETGKVLCTAVLVQCVQFPSSKAPPDDYGDFAPGRWGWILKEVKVLNNPKPAKGKLGLWNYEEIDDFTQDDEPQKRLF